jgi:hypothetical protein
VDHSQSTASTASTALWTMRLSKGGRDAIIVVLFAIAIVGFAVFLYRCIRGWGYNTLQGQSQDEHGDVETHTYNNHLHAESDDSRVRGHTNGGRIEFGDVSNPMFVSTNITDDEDDDDTVTKTPHNIELDFDDSESVFTVNYTNNEHTETLDSIQADKISKAGYLLKQSTNLAKDWQRRWFFVVEGKLFYVHKPADLTGKKNFQAVCVGGL